MRVGRYADGREVTYDQSGHQFAVGETLISLEQVLQYDAFDQIEWLSGELRVWAQGLQVLPDTAAAHVATKGGRLLGFRSHRVWKMAAATSYYVSWLIVTLALLTPPYPPGARDTVLVIVKAVAFSLLMISPALVLSDFSYGGKIPLFGRRTMLSTAMGFVVLFLMFLVTFGLADSLHSEAYRVAAEQDSIERQRQEQESEPPLATPETSTTATQPSATPKSDDAQAQSDLGDITDPELRTNFVTACALIGVDLEEVKKVQQLPDWASGERYSFSYQSNGLEVYANADKSISSINLGDLHVFEQGFEPLAIDDYLMDWQTHGELQVRAERAVKEALNYPDSADFPWLDGPGTGRRHNIYFIGGALSAENAFGVRKDTSYYIEYEKSGETLTVRYFRLDGENLIGQKSVLPEIQRKELAASQSDGAIVLVDGVCGDYGESKQIDGDAYIWYDVPPGEYEVSSQTGMTKLYLDKDKMIRNSDTNGYWECVSVQTLDFAQAGGQQRLSVSEGQHIELTVRAKVTLTPVK